MLEVAPVEEGDGENRGAITSPKGAPEEGGSTIPPSRGRRGPPPKTRRPKPLSGGRNLRRRVQEWVARAKLIRCPAPLPETAPEPVLVRMLEVAPVEEGDGENRGAITSPKGAPEEGGSTIPPSRGRRGPPPKTRRPKPLSGGRNLRRRVLHPRRPRPHSLL